MTLHAYREDQLVEQPAIVLFAKLGWDIACGNPLPKGEGVLSDSTGLLGRETKGEVVLASRLRAALVKLNPSLPPEAIKPDPAALEFSARAACLATIADAIRATINPGPVDISEVMGQVQEVLDNSITGVDMPDKPVPLIDLSRIDFEKLRGRIKTSKHKGTDLERLKAAIRAQLEKLIQLNRTRTDYLEKFEELIESYNNGSRNIEQILEDLLNFAENLSEEEQRHVREHLSEEELTIFDILTRPGPELSTEERDEVKKVAHQVLVRLKSLLALDWRRQTQARAKVRLAIEDELDNGLPRTYTPEIYQSKCSAIFEHVYESYYGEGDGVYS